MALRRRRIIGPGFPYLSVPILAGEPEPPGDYEGPFEVWGAATRWVGLRAYSAAAAAAGVNAIKIQRPDTSQADVPVLSTGLLDSTGLTSGGPYSVVTFYDQSGAGDTMTTAAGNFLLTFDAGIPSLEWVTGYLVGGTLALSQPMTFSVVAGSPATVTGANYPFISDGTTCGILFNPSGVANTVGLSFGGGPINATAADGALHAVQALAAGTGSIIRADGGTDVTGDAGTSGMSGIWYPFVSDVGFKIREIGIWSGDKSADFTDMYNNQIGFWTDL